MQFKTGEHVYYRFPTRGSAGEANFDPSPAAAPVGTLIINGADSGATVTITAQGGGTVGEYVADWVMPTLVDGDVIQLRVRGPIGGATDKVIFSIGQGVANGRQDVLKLNGSATAAAMLALMFSKMRMITVDTATFSPTTTVFETDQTTNNIEQWREQVLYGLDGANAGVSVPVSAYAFTNSKVKLTLADALPAAPSNGHRFLVMGRVEQ